MAVYGVVIDHADGLHEGIENDGANKFEAAFFHVFGHSDRFGTIHRGVFEMFPSVLNGCSADETPEIFAKINIVFIAHFDKNLRVTYRGIHF